MLKTHHTLNVQKVDPERRFVYGFATLNNVDMQNDQVPVEVSLRAFSKFRGNVREQHSNLAVGKVLSYGIKKFVDQITGRIYDGVFVKVYISKGAETTWEKVLDGTLSGFSIGGTATDFEREIHDGRVVNVIKDYQIMELSLVDNPANQLANIISIEKSASAMEKELNNVAENSDVVVEDSATSEFVDSAPVDNIEDIVVSGAPEPVAEPVGEPVVEPEAVVEPTVEPVTEPVVETPDNAAILANAINELKTLITERDTTWNSIVSQLTDLSNTVSTVSTAVDSVQGELALVKSQFGDLTKINDRVSSLEGATAIRKSGDLGEVVQEPKRNKSIWGGAFLTTTDL